MNRYLVTVLVLIFWSGSPAEAEDLQVNTYTTNDQASPSIAVDDDGDFIVVWRSRGSSGTDSDVFSIQGRLGPPGSRLVSHLWVARCDH